jgi:2-oxoglutarate ferredoxin oxidoreductase subunit alpha
MTWDINIMVAGAAGQGMQTIGAVLGKVLVRGGCSVFAMQDNMSRIRGGHNFFQLRVSEKPVKAPSMSLHLLIGLNDESISLHSQEVLSDGIILFDSEKSSISEKDQRYSGIPLERLAKEEGGEKLFSNSVAVGAALALLKWDFERLKVYFGEYFADKPDMVDGNIKAARAGFEYVNKKGLKFNTQGLETQETPPRMFLTGHEAVVLGALAAGCQFMSAYPMSPSTAIMMNLAGRAKEFDMVVEQAEDEIAAINMAIGASYAGLRSMTATSGGGFSLMVEALGLAGISETPLVVVEAQRPGPATGLPTRTAQGDLLFTLHASQDEFPRVILAPGTAREAFYQTIHAFDVAEKYQVPVIILTDQFLAESYFTEDRFDLSDITINRHLLTQSDSNELENYKRYRFIKSGISPRAVPGNFEFEIVADSHEHDEDGHMTEDQELRRKMMEKRFRKLKEMTKELGKPTQMGDPKADFLLVGWGSTFGVMSEAIEILNKDGVSVRGVHLSQLWPFPKGELLAHLESAKRWGVAEGNYTGQLARLIKTELQRTPHGQILKYTGRPFLPEEIAESFIKEVVTQ